MPLWIVLDSRAQSRTILILFSGVARLASTDELDDFDPGAGGELEPVPLGALYNSAVHFNGNARRIERETGEETGESFALCRQPQFPIHDDLDRLSGARRLTLHFANHYSQSYICFSFPA